MNAATQTQPILSARGIVNRFGKQELHDNISLDVLPGEILGIAGGSGSVSYTHLTLPTIYSV